MATTKTCSSSGGKLKVLRRRGTGGSPLQSPISKLGDDLLVRILILAPEPRSAGRWKLVCKRWNSMISDPYFIRRFASHHRSGTSCESEPPLLPVDEPAIILRFIPVPLMFRSNFCVMDSFKDLLLCGFTRGLKRGFPCTEEARSYIICHQFTKQWIALPLAPERSVKCRECIARLVCEPINSSNFNLLDDDGREVFIYSEYRFRVVCMYDSVHDYATKLDVFCSESGEWTKEALVLHDQFIKFPNAVSLDGNLYWMNYQNQLVGCNPFCLDIPPTFLDGIELLGRRDTDSNLSTSQGALYVIRIEYKTYRYSRHVLSVWRLEEDAAYWRRQYGVLLNTLIPDYKQHSWSRVQFSQHPEKPEIVFLQALVTTKCSMFFSCNLLKGEGELVLHHPPRLPDWKAFQPRIFGYWPTPIPRYNQLRCIYNGSYGCLLQSSREATPPITERQPVKGAEQIGQARKKTYRHRCPKFFS